MMAEVHEGELLKELGGFTGTEYYHRHWLGLVYTDGIKYLADKAGAHWLIDLVASYQGKLKREEFQVWRIRVNEKREATVDCWSDVPEKSKKLVEQFIPFTDFPLEMYEFYCINGTILLKSEY